MLRRALTFLGYLYLLRVPLLAWLAVFGMWYGFREGSGAEPMLRGIYDLSDSSNLMERFIYVTVAAFLAATAMTVAATLIIRNANDRMEIAAVRFSPGLKFLVRLIPLSTIILTLGAAMQFRGIGASAARVTLGIALGVVIWYFLTAILQKWAWSNASFTDLLSKPSLIPDDGAGYLTAANDRIRPRHVFAAIAFTIAFLTYVGYWLVSYSKPDIVPTLALILMLIMLLCFGLSGVTFFLDRYRVPVLMLLVAIAWIPGIFPQSDHFYSAIRLGPRPSNLGSELIQRSPREIPILVAATGGGIQASSWTARVLTCLSLTMPPDVDFERSIRLISSVSGGSVGSMFFVGHYDHGDIPSAYKGISAGGCEVHDSKIIEAAETSSLDEVAWGLAYPDLVLNVFPFTKGIGPDDGPDRRWHLVDGGNIFVDRGRMLENSWRAHLPDGQRNSTLSSWRVDVQNGNRPAVIFNSTIVETGQRYLLATTSFDRPAGQRLDDRLTGRIEFGVDIYPGYSTLMATAARLSASFPVVSPAARILDNITPPRRASGTAHEHDSVPDIYTAEYHAVDGGYYDNYGMATLLDWLDSALVASSPQQNESDKNQKEVQDLRPKKIAIIEIRSSPEDEPAEAAGGGFVFQTLNPALALVHVRSAGQLSHNALDKDLLRRLAKKDHIDVCPFVFEFKNVDDRGCRRAEPLNWHLTPEDKIALDKAVNSSEIIQTRKSLEKYLHSGECKQ